MAHSISSSARQAYWRLASFVKAGSKSPYPADFSADEIKILEAVIVRDGLHLAAGQLELRDGRVLVGTASDPIELVSLQPAGKKAMKAADWWRGRPTDAGTLAR